MDTRDDLFSYPNTEMVPRFPSSMKDDKGKGRKWNCLGFFDSRMNDLVAERIGGEMLLMKKSLVPNYFEFLGLWKHDLFPHYESEIQIGRACLSHQKIIEAIRYWIYTA